jgi:hypothetical protein
MLRNGIKDNRWLARRKRRRYNNIDQNGIVVKSSNLIRKDSYYGYEQPN